MSPLHHHGPAYVDELFASLVRGADDRALAVLDRAGDDLPMPEVAVAVIQPVLDRIGEAWQSGRIGVAEEHFSTEVLRAWILQAGRRTPAAGHAVLLACVEGERHALGLDLLHMLLRREGWASLNLGADVPTPALRAAVTGAVFRPRAVLLSVGMPQRIPALADAAAALAELPEEERPAVVYGGRPFRDGPGGVPGATWLAPDAARALPGLRRLVEGMPAGCG